jgi:hypothetical protein
MEIQFPADELSEEYVRNIIYRHFSPYTFISSFEEEKDVVKISVGLKVPEVLDDEKNNKRIIRFLTFNNMFIIDGAIERKKMILHAPSRREVIKICNDRYTAVVIKSEQSLLKTTYQKLVLVPEVQVAMRPIRKILIKLERFGETTLKELINVQSRLSSNKGERYLHYLRLLEALDIIKKENGKYVQGSNMKNYIVRDISPPELYEQILAEVLERSYPYLRQVLNLTMIVPFLRWSNAYYLPSYEANEKLYLGEESLIEHYMRFYKYTTSDPSDQIQRILDTQIIRMEQNLITGNSEILNDYFEKAEQDKILLI